MSLSQTRGARGPLRNEVWFALMTEDGKQGTAGHRGDCCLCGKLGCSLYAALEIFLELTFICLS